MLAQKQAGIWKVSEAAAVDVPSSGLRNPTHEAVLDIENTPAVAAGTGTEVADRDSVSGQAFFHSSSVVDGGVGRVPAGSAWASGRLAPQGLSQRPGRQKVISSRVGDFRMDGGNRTHNHRL